LIAGVEHELITVVCAFAEYFDRAKQSLIDAKFIDALKPGGGLNPIDAPGSVQSSGLLGSSPITDAPPQPNKRLAAMTARTTRRTIAMYDTVSVPPYGALKRR
jgi:hypothetical protein